MFGPLSKVIFLCTTAFLCAVSPVRADLTSTRQSQTALAEILLGEIALQRGLYADAWFAYTDATRLTSDKALAERSYKIAQVMKDKGRMAKSKALLDQLAPDNDVNLLTRALEACKAGQWKSAEATLTQAAQKSDDVLSLFEQFAEQSAALADKKERYALLLILREHAEPNAYLERTLAYAAKDAKLNQKALQHALAASDLAPDDTQLLLESVDFEFRLAPEKAKERLAKHIKAYPQDVRARIAYAKALARTRKKDAARKELHHTIAASPSDAQVWFLCALVAQEMRDFDAAVRYYNRFISLAQTDEDNRYIPDPAYAQLAVIALSRNEPETALDWLSKVQKGDKYIPARLKQVQILQALGRIDEACSVLTEIRTDDTARKAEFLFYAGQILSEAKRHAEAMRYLDQALKLAPQNTDILYRTAMVAEQLGWIEQAQTHLKTFIRLRPNDSLGYNSLGYMWLEHGVPPTQVRPLIEKAMELSKGKDGSIVDSLGWLYYREGNLTEAEKWIRKALALSPDEPEITLHLAQILVDQNKLKEARRVLSTLLTKDPKNSQARMLLKRISP